MVKEIFSKIINSIESKIINKEISIDSSKFIDVESVSDGSIAFVDGGQAELLKANDFSLQFIRVGCVVFDGKVKKKVNIEEFFVLISMNGDEYETEIFPVKGEGVSSIKINSFDETIMDGKERGSISKVGGIIRRFAEISLASRSDASIVVLDGSLKTMIKGEKEKMEELTSSKLVAGLAKTSTIIENGKCVMSSLGKRNGEWCYELEDSYVIKLNRNSNYVFEFTINRKEELQKVLGMMINQSNDAVFPGYPYGLILADKVARVSNEEREYLLTRFKSQAGKKWEKISRGLNVKNAHDILDGVG